jgi:hypothetical protein
MIDSSAAQFQEKRIKQRTEGLGAGVYTHNPILDNLLHSYLPDLLLYAKNPPPRITTTPGKQRTVFTEPTTTALGSVSVAFP